MAWVGHPTDGPMPGMATPQEINRLGWLLAEEADELFLRLKITHHEAAVPMARAMLEEGAPPVVEQLARGIVASQRAEIEVMQEMLQDTGAPPAEDPAKTDGKDTEGGHHH
jgi:uncharacterized protein (DUF305 family)